MRQLEIMYGTQTGSAAITVKKPQRLYGHRADRLCVQINVEFTNANVAAQDIDEAFFRNSKFDWRYRDGEGFVVSTPLAAMEWGNQVLKRRWAGALVQCNPTVQITASSAETRAFYFDIDLAVPIAARPVDFSQALAELGDLVFTPAATGNADVTVTNVEIIVSAYGIRTDGLYSGSRLRFSTHAGQAPLTQDQVALRGKLVALLAFTKDGTVPIASTKPSVKIGDAMLLDVKNLNTLDIVKHLGSPRWELFPQRPQTSTAAGDFIDDIGHLVIPEEGFDIGKLEGRPGDQAVVDYDSNAATAGKHFYLAIELIPRGSCFNRAVPGAAEMKPEDFERYVQRPTLGPGVITDALKPYLPELIGTPQVKAQLQC